MSARSPSATGRSRRWPNTPEFTGRIIDALARDPALLDRTGQVLIGAEIGAELGVTDGDGSQPVSHRAVLGDPPTFSTAVVV